MISLQPLQGSFAIGIQSIDQFVDALSEFGIATVVGRQNEPAEVNVLTQQIDLTVREYRSCPGQRTSGDVQNW